MDEEKKAFTVDGYSEWQNDPAVVGVNRLRRRATLMPYEHRDEAIKGNRMLSERCMSLNGSWKFRLFEGYGKLSYGFAEPDFNSDGWDSITVPSCWAMEGYDYPQYCNIQYPWEGNERLNPPQAPTEYNPVGCYIKRFTLPETWEGERVVICFDGVESAFYLYVNGKKYGYSESSFNTAEFDITELLHKGENVIALEVYRWCTASWLEDQDFWRMGGIFRDVYLFMTHSQYVFDLTVKPELDLGFKSGKLQATVELGHEDDNLEVEMTVFDGNGDIAAFDSHSVKGEGRVNLSATIPFVKLWSAEHPYLYNVVVSLTRPTGEFLEFVSCRTGFRKLEIREGVIYLNGKRLLLKGTDRHEFSHKRGRAISTLDMERDIAIMKSHNINAVRTSHYPNNPYWYELCDEYGIYVIDENNLETHGTQNLGGALAPLLPSSSVVWRNACMDRITALYQRDKNHPSIIGWSLGNESSAGDNFVLMTKYLRQQDDTRFIHYENISNDDPQLPHISDVYSTMYEKPHDLEKSLLKYNDKPYMLCEYSHAMGNSCGGNEGYFELMDKYKHFQGVFVWDFIDQAIAVKKDGKEYLAYGGDFGENPHDGNFCGNGLIFADRTLTPKIIEMKRLYQNVRIKAVDAQKGIVEITNNFLFTNLSEFNLHWQQIKSGTVVDSGDTVLSLEPGETKAVDLKLIEKPEGEWYLNVLFELKTATSWAKAGHVVAEAQFVVNEYQVEKTAMEDKEMLVRTEYGTVYVNGGGLEARLSRRTGRLYYLSMKGKQLLSSPVELSFWRALTDNDRGNHQKVRCGAWRLAGEDADMWIRQETIRDHGTSVTVEAGFAVHTQPESYGTLKYTFTSKGVTIDMSFTPGEGLPEIPEVGLRFNTVDDFYRVDYLGKGPHENYIDRCASAKVGLYKLEIDELFTSYLKPQENGERTDVRYAVLQGADKQLRLEAADKAVELNLCRWTPEELEEAAHPCDLPESNKLCVRVLAAQMGVGGFDSWGAHTLEKYKLHTDREYRLSVNMVASVR